MGLVIAEAEDRVRRLLNILDRIECRIEQSADVLEASQMGDLHTRENAPELLEKEYVRWASRLADVLGVPLYPYSQRFRKYVGGGGNIPVRR